MKIEIWEDSALILGHASKVGDEDDSYECTEEEYQELCALYYMAEKYQTKLEKIRRRGSPLSTVSYDPAKVRFLGESDAIEEGWLDSGGRHVGKF